MAVHPTTTQSWPGERQFPLDRPFISVIIPAHNEEAFLPKTLDALQRQDFKSFEVIIVANGCTDNTEGAARGKCDQFIRLEERSLGKARNLGGKMARGEILLFLDADTILEPQTLREIARCFHKPYAMGTIKGRPDTNKPSYRFIYFLKNMVHKLRLHYGSSGVILCWKGDFMAVGGFDEALYLRENSELMKRLRFFGRYRYIPQAVAITSMRRYNQRGTVEMILLWTKVWFLSKFADIRHKTYEVVEKEQESRLQSFKLREFSGKVWKAIELRLAERE